MHPARPLRGKTIWGKNRRQDLFFCPACFCRLSSLSGAGFDVLLTHESPRDAILPDHGSEDVGSLIRCALPAFAFFGHYHSTGRQVEGDFGATARVPP
jgi:hypothetical protein